MSTAIGETVQRKTDSASVWQIDPAHSEVGFAVKHMMFATVKGRFAGVEGVLRLNEADPSATAVSVRIDAATIDTRNEQRDAHLRSADFFDVEKYPELTWVSRAVEKLDDTRYRVTGDLTLHGVTREVVLDATETGRGTDPWGSTKIGFSATGLINRGDFGLKWNQALEAGGMLVSDEVRIVIEVQAARID